MKFTKETAKRIKAHYGVDITNITTVDEIVKAFEHATYRVIMDADLFDDTIHCIEDVSGNIIDFNTDPNDANKIIYIGLE